MTYNRTEVTQRRAAGLKRCWKCQSEKPFSEFSKCKSRSDGLEPICKACCRDERHLPKNRERDARNRRRWRAANRERFNAIARQNYNPKKEKLRKIAWRKRDPEAARAPGKKWRTNNREIANAASRDAKRRRRAISRETDILYRQNNKDKIKKKNRQWRQKNAERLKRQQAEYVRNHRGEVNARTAKRTAAKLNATPPWADLDAIKLIYIKAARLTKETRIPHEVDHIYPLQGKFSCGLHVPWNLRIVTRTANRSKGNKLPEQAIKRHHDRISDSQGRPQ